jgi:hypothetical protein
MTYATNSNKSGAESNFLYRIKLRRRIENTDTNNTLVIAWNEDNVQNVWLSTIECIYDINLSVDNSYKYDLEANTITLNTSGDPTYIIVEYYVFFATRDVAIGNPPTQEDAAKYFWEGIVVSTPTVSALADQSQLGFVTTTASALSLVNANGYLNRHFHLTSWNFCEIDIWHCIGEVQDSFTYSAVFHYQDSNAYLNYAHVFTGYTTDVSFSETTIEVSVVDRSKDFDTSFTFASGGYQHFFSSELGANIDPKMISAPMPMALGFTHTLVCTNYDYSETISTSTNMYYVAFCWSGVRHESHFLPIDAGECTTTTTGHTGNRDISAGHFVIFCRLDGTRIWREVLTSDTVTSTFTHAALPSKMVANEYVLVNPITNVTMYDGSVEGWVTLNMGSDYIIDVEFTPPAYYVMIKFQAALGLAIDPEKDIISCTTEGLEAPYRQVYQTYAITEAYNRAEVQLHHLLIAAGLPVSTDWTWWRGRPASYTSSEMVSMILPLNIGDPIPTLREIVTMYATQMLSMIYWDTEGGGYNYRQLKNIDESMVDFAIDDNDIELGTVKYTYSYTDVYNSVLANYDPAQIDNAGRKIESGFWKKSVVYNINVYPHHRVNRNIEVNTFFAADYDAGLGNYVENWCHKYMSIFAEPQGRLSFNAISLLQSCTIGDVIQVTLKSMAGSPYSEEGTARLFRVEQIQRSLNGVFLQLTDQQGIERNTTHWPTALVP